MKMDLEFNKLQWLIYHKTNQVYIKKFFLNNVCTCTHFLIRILKNNNAYS